MKICFLGNMNNWPYAIAKRMVARGYDVTFFVDAPRDYMLDRPEARDPSLTKGYPPWIVELKTRRSKSYAPYLLPAVVYRKEIALLNEFDVVFLNCMWISVGPYLNRSTVVIDLFAGGDLDYCAPRFAFQLAAEKCSRSTLPYPAWALERFYARVWGNQARGVRRAQVVDYYARGINPESDALLAHLKRGQDFRHVPRAGSFDADEFAYSEPDPNRRAFEILGVARFNFLTDRNDNKRNDIMIEGIGRFVRENGIEQGLVITFFEKGPDAGAAKALCEQVGIARFVVWHEVVPLHELEVIFRRCDVVFDQLGSHMVGGGGYGMLVGRPLIANGRPDLFESIYGEKSPICQATTVEEVCEWLTRLYKDRSLVRSIGRASSDFVRKHQSIDASVDAYLEHIEYFRSKARNARS
jgi:glycosyltransferase involved in cell wall biosynthesis